MYSYISAYSVLSKAGIDLASVDGLKIFFVNNFMACIIQVKASVIWEYIKSCTLTMGLLALLFHVGYNACAVGTNIWLAKWSTDEDEEAENMTLTT